MALYKITFKKSVHKDFKKIASRKERKAIFEAIDNLAKNPRPVGVVKLKVTKTDYWRIRIGVYRVVYEIDDTDKSISIFTVGHRKQIYRKT
jgi:mRNA interferase RelE/StbE